LGVGQSSAGRIPPHPRRTIGAFSRVFWLASHFARLADNQTTDAWGPSSHPWSRIPDPPCPFFAFSTIWNLPFQGSFPLGVSHCVPFLTFPPPPPIQLAVFAKLVNELFPSPALPLRLFPPPPRACTFAQECPSRSPRTLCSLCHSLF